MKNIFDTRKLRTSEIIVHNTSGELIPANSFARIVTYNKTSQRFDIEKPDSDGILSSFVAIIPEKIAPGGNGVGIIDGAAVVKKSSTDTIEAGETVGTKENSWLATASSGFSVLSVDGDFLVIRRAAADRILVRISQTLQREDPVAIPPLDAIDWYEFQFLEGNTPTPRPKAWVFGYTAYDYPTTPNLLETDHWYQVGDIVEVMEYTDSRWPSRKWWIMETVSRIQAGQGDDIRCSLWWFQEIDGVKEARRGSVYR